MTVERETLKDEGAEKIVPGKSIKNPGSESHVGLTGQKKKECGRGGNGSYIGVSVR